MKCPRCPLTTLMIAERLGIEVDYCPDCRGVWLDRGELDKVIERTNQQFSERRRHDDDDDDDDDRRDRRFTTGYPAKKKKKVTSILGDIFDFG